MTQKTMKPATLVSMATAKPRVSAPLVDCTMASLRAPSSTCAVSYSRSTTSPASCMAAYTPALDAPPRVSSQISYGSSASLACR